MKCSNIPEALDLLNAVHWVQKNHVSITIYCLLDEHDHFEGKLIASLEE